MLQFKHNKTGAVIEVDEEFAKQVIIPQNHYTKVEAPSTKVEAPKKSKKKTVKGNK